jgi:glycosyltransferase involved in cell wall biosynthesis
MINVLHLTSSFGLGGGAERNLLRLVCNMDRSRFQNTVVTMTAIMARDYEYLRSQLTGTDVRVYSLGMRQGQPTVAGILLLLRIIRCIGPSTLQTWMYPADLLGLLAGKWAGVPSIAWNIRGCSLDAAGFRWMSRAVRRLLVALSSFPDVVLVNSQSGLEFHRTLGYRPRKWLYMPNSIELDSFKPDEEAGIWLRSSLGLAKQSQLVGLIARLHPIKDHRTFIKAASLVASNNPDVHFVLVGTGIDKDRYIDDLVAATGAADRFHLLGHRLDVNRITAGLDVACSSSFSEGSSNTVIEAMASGVVCVATDVGESSLILRGIGRVVPPREPEVFAQACRELLAMPKPQRRKLGMDARARVEKCFSLSKVVADYESLYEELAPTLPLNCRVRQPFRIESSLSRGEPSAQRIF